MAPQPPTDPLAARLAAMDWQAVAQDQGAAAGVPTMLSREEQALYLMLGATATATGAGAIVDLGCFAGGSTARLAEGARRAGSSAPIHAFDRFTADERAKAGILYRQGIPPFEGADIFPLARRLLAPWAPAITFHRGEIDRLGWDGGPIGLLVMDASKSDATMDRMAETFFPHLIPGRSLVVQQDYLHWSQPWVPAQMERLAGAFAPLAFVPRDTVVFRCTARPDMAAGRTEGLSDAALLAALSAAAHRLAPLGIAGRLEETAAALRANPGKRRAFRFRRP